MTKRPKQNLLFEIGRKALALEGPEALLRGPFRPRTGKNEAALYWGKAALPFFRATGEPSGPALILSPDPRPSDLPSRVDWFQGEHPFPGLGSFRAGEAILEFFDVLRREQVRKVRVYLSGGASSLAWIIPRGISEEALQSRLRDLYARPLTIEALNRERSRLCLLKNGGAAHWLEVLSPRTRAEVFLISDVSPFGPEVVGSGPFVSDVIPHRILADNPALVERSAELAREQGLQVVHASGGHVDGIHHWVRMLRENLEALASGRDSVLILGGEPRIPLGPGPGKGGRMTHLAAIFVLELLPAFTEGRAEILFAATDGKDGRSNSGGISFGPLEATQVQDWARFAMKARRSIRARDTATFWRGMSALLPESSSFTNLQDLVLVRLSAGKRFA